MIKTQSYYYFTMDVAYLICINSTSHGCCVVVSSLKINIIHSTCIVKAINLGQRREDGVAIIELQITDDNIPQQGGFL